MKLVLNLLIVFLFNKKLEVIFLIRTLYILCLPSIHKALKNPDCMPRSLKNVFKIIYILIKIKKMV